MVILLLGTFHQTQPLELGLDALHLFMFPGTARFPATIEQEAPLLCAVIPVLFIQIKQTRASVLLPVVVAHFEGGQIQHIFVPGLIRVDGPFNVQIQNLSDAGAGLAHAVGVVEGEIGGSPRVGLPDAGVEQP